MLFFVIGLSPVVVSQQEIDALVSGRHYQSRSAPRPKRR